MGPDERLNPLTRRPSKVALLAFVLIAFGCNRRSEMSRCFDKWQALVTSHDTVNERQRADSFAECARKPRVVYTILLKDPTSGSELPVSALHQHAGAVAVELTTEADGRQQRFQWTARSSESVYPLLLE